MKRVFFQTQGCRLNHSETEVLQRSFERNGYRVVGEDESADICVVNTCTVTEQAGVKNRQMLRHLHKKHPNAEISVVGCYSEMFPEELAEMEGVRIVVGNEEKMRLAEHMAESLHLGTSSIVKPKISRKPFQSPVISLGAGRSEFTAEPKIRGGFHTRASLKIQDGCDFMCSFCIIPFARGRSRYREFFNLLDEAKLFAEEGVREIVLTGVNIGTYFESGRTLLKVIDALNEIKDLVRIRISSIEPTTVPEGVLDRMADDLHKLVPFLHLPVQSGSDPILTAMKRRYTAKAYAVEVMNVWERVPGVCIGTDVMTGFPGESVKQFLDTRDLLSDLPLTYFHVFPFSARMKTPAHLLEGRVPPLEIRRRSSELRELSDLKRGKILKSLLGTVQEVLFEARKPDGSQSGYTSAYTRVTLEDKGTDALRNQILPVRINSIQGAKVLGSLVTSGTC